MLKAPPVLTAALFRCKSAFVKIQNYCGSKIYNIHDGVTRIGVGAFRSCAYLYEVTVPDSVTVLDELAFAESVNIRDLKLSDNITDIGFRALSSLDSLVSIEIPDSVVNIAEKAFWDCESLERIHFAGTKQQWNNYGLTGEDISYAKITFGK